MKITVDAIIAAIQRRGSDAIDLRDAVHEAHHALVAKCRRKWTRDAIHEALMDYTNHVPAQLVSEEVNARAVEQIVCADFKLECGSIDHWADIAWWETIKNMQITLPGPEWIATCVRNAMRRPDLRRAADAIIALGKTSTRKRQRT